MFVILPPQAILLTVYTCVRVHVNVCDLASSSHPIDCVCACAHECLCKFVFKKCFGSLLCNRLYAPIWNKGVHFILFYFLLSLDMFTITELETTI